MDVHCPQFSVHKASRYLTPALYNTCNEHNSVASRTELLNAKMNHPDWLAQILAALPDGIKTPLETQQTEVLIALLVLLVTIAVIVLSRLVAPKKASGSSVLIAGPCNAGKTMLFMQLRDGTTHNGTVASMQENSGVVSVNNDRGQTVGSVSVVDVPGHERLRRILEKRLDDASAVVFVIDAADITPHKVSYAVPYHEIPVQ